jgi:Tfp pilus assembly protein PilN
MSAKTVDVNLLEKDEFSDSPIGHIVTWAITYGRYIMISTEIIVLLAFVSRFSLDRKLTDLNEAIGQKQAIIEANQPFEEEVSKIQTQLARTKTLMSTQVKPVEILGITKNILPMDVMLDSLTITPDKIAAQATIGSTEGFAILMNNLQATKQFLKIDINEIKKLPTGGFQLQYTIVLTQPKTTPAVKKTTESSTP